MEGSHMDSIRQFRETNARKNNEPFLAEERRVIQNSGALYVNVTSSASNILGVERGDDVMVSTYEDFVVVEKLDKTEEDDE